MDNESTTYSLGICIPVWNRGELFAIGFASLLNQLQNIKASIWIYDNGSDEATRRVIEAIPSHPPHTIVKTFFSENRGIPYVANLFVKAIQEECDYVNEKVPDYLMIMDADAYFKKPLVDLIQILEQEYSVGLVSGHDSIEHASILDTAVVLGERRIEIKEKENERMITMLMKREEFIYNYPFAHYRNRDVDWEITLWGPNALKKRFRRLFVAPGYVLHLGIATSTWNTGSASPATDEEKIEVEKILKKIEAVNHFGPG